MTDQSMQADAFDPASNHLDARVEPARGILRRRRDLVVTRHDTGAEEIRVDAGRAPQAARLLAKVQHDLHTTSVPDFFREWRLLP